MVTRL